MTALAALLLVMTPLPEWATTPERQVMDWTSGAPKDRRYVTHELDFIDSNGKYHRHAVTLSDVGWGGSVTGVGETHREACQSALNGWHRVHWRTATVPIPNIMPAIPFPRLVLPR